VKVRRLQSANGEESEGGVGGSGARSCKERRASRVSGTEHSTMEKALARSD
jgi:hypothetical protein